MIISVVDLITSVETIDTIAVEVTVISGKISVAVPAIPVPQKVDTWSGLHDSVVFQ
jgi:hypothetical protein